MKFTIPFSLRRSLFAGFFMSLSASAADYTVDASQTSDPGRKVYQTLAELASAGVLAAGDTVILNNDDSSLTSKLPVLVNFRSNDPETPRTVDLSGLGNTPLFSPAKGNYTLNMESVVFSNAPARVFFYNNSSSSAPISLKISDNVSFTKNYSSDRNSFTANGYGGAICLYSSAATALSMGNNAMFADNRAAGNGGAISIHSYGKTASLTIGNNAVFSGNYASGNGGGAVQVYGATGSAAVIGDNATFTGNYLLGGYGGSGGAIYVVMPDSTNYGGNSLVIGSNAVFSGNYVSGRYSNGGAIALSSSSRSETSSLVLGPGAVFTGNYVFSSASPSYESIGSGGAIYITSSRYSNITVRDGATFTGNYAWTKGGAILMQGS